MAAEQKAGLVDLERELTCSICTEILYQPLTLLKCLHTFCGSCLKEWFSWQGGQTAPTDPDHPFTCPSCRAVVYETKPNAGVTTLLDIFQKANPEKGKSSEDKADIEKRYKPGDEVLPKVRPRVVSREDEEDRRQLEQVMGLSLQEVGINERSRLDVPNSRSRRRSRSRDGRSRSGGSTTAEPQSRPRERSTHAVTTTTSWASPSSSRGRSQPSVETAARQLEHQSSLRSILSATEIDPSKMEEEIMRQIMEEGLLDGIDLNNIDVSQEDELSERIAAAYKRKQRERQQVRSARQSDAGPRPTIPSETIQVRPRRHSRSRSGAFPVTAAPAQSSPQHQQAPINTSAGSGSTQRVAPPTQRTIRRASIDIATTSRPVLNTVQNHEPSRPIVLEANSRSTTDPDAAVTAWTSPRTDGGNTAGSSDGLLPAPLHIPRPKISLSNQAQAGSRPRTDSAENLGSRQSMFVEPRISCDRCGRDNIQYERHLNCTTCNGGDFYICLSCYRNGKGCMNWYGFGRASWRSYEAKAPPGGYPAGQSLPHSLTNRRYGRPGQALTQTTSNSSSRQMTSDDPAKRLQTGFFCDICLESANSCYWKCEVCNEGEWGFCNRCTNQGRCCTHPLLPLVNLPSPTRQGGQDSVVRSPPIDLPPSAYLYRGPSAIEIGPLKPLIFNTVCDICRTMIVPNSQRFHCPVCKNGDYNICVPCYTGLVNNGKIAQRNGPNGWRRCPQNHRTIVVSFGEVNGGQMRKIDRDLVGGVALEESSGPSFEGKWFWSAEGGERKEKRLEASSPSSGDSAAQSNVFSQLPPDGGKGLKAYARWSYFPADKATDELMFPKHAELREVQDVNEQWYLGVYAGAKGWLPAARVIIS